MTPMSRIVQFGCFTASNPGQNSTRRDNEKESEIWGGRGKKSKISGGPAEGGLAGRVVLEGCPGTKTKEKKNKHDKLFFV